MPFPREFDAIDLGVGLLCIAAVAAVCAIVGLFFATGAWTMR